MRDVRHPAADAAMNVYVAGLLLIGVLAALGIVQSEGKNPTAWGLLLLVLLIALWRLG